MGSDSVIIACWKISAILTHAPRGGATRYAAKHETGTGISIHAPREGSDYTQAVAKDAQAAFQSTLPVGGATGQDLESPEVASISIHAPRGGSDYHARRK